MKLAVKSLLSLAMMFALVAVVPADDKEADKEKTLKGSVTCAKCDLKKESKCATVIVVKEDGKDVTYYFDKESDKKYHKDICTEAKEGSVTAVIAEKDGKKWVTKVSKVEYTKS